MLLGFSVYSLGLARSLNYIISIRNMVQININHNFNMSLMSCPNSGPVLPVSCLPSSNNSFEMDYVSEDSHSPSVASWQWPCLMKVLQKYVFSNADMILITIN